MPIELPSLTVTNASAWRQWLIGNHSTSPGIWLTQAKKGTTNPTSLTYPQALEEALCYGWIDGQAAPVAEKDSSLYARRFTPRRAKSNWSTRNVSLFEQLEKDGRTAEPGRIVAEAAKKDGRWEAAYAGPATAEAPEDLMVGLREVPSALATWEGLNSTNRYAIYMRLINLKTVAGREKRIQAFVDMLAKGETPVPQKKSTEKTRAGPSQKSTGTEKVKVVGKEDKPKAVKASVVEPSRRTRSGRHVPDKY